MKNLCALLALSILLSACGGVGSGPSVIIPISADKLERFEYTGKQVDAYKKGVIFETGQLNVVAGMAFNFDIPDSDWLPFIARSKAFCDTARTEGWDVAKSQYLDQALREATNAMPSEFGGFEPTDVPVKEILETIAGAQFRAIAAEDSLCPELAPEEVMTGSDSALVPNADTEPLLAGQYFGEGCAGAGQALLALLVVLDDIKNVRGGLDEMNERLLNINAGLQYAKLSEPNSRLTEKISDAGIAVFRLHRAFKNNDPDKFGAEVTLTAKEAIDVIDACGLENSLE